MPPVPRRRTTPTTPRTAPNPYTLERRVVRPVQRQVGASSEDDMPYGAVILKWPGRITLSSGATTKIVDLPAGRVA